MSDLDAILRSGEYADRRRRDWILGPLSDVWATDAVTPRAGARRWRTTDEMRLLIILDRHRAECPGLLDCDDHPVPYVVRLGSGWCAHRAGATWGDYHQTFAEAIAAARDMTGEKK